MVGAQLIFSLLFTWVSLILGLLDPGNGFEPLIELPVDSSENFGFWGDEKKTVVSVKEFGAKGDGYIDDTSAFENAWNYACLFSPSVLEIPKGEVFLVGPIDFAGPCPSKVTIKISGEIVAPDPSAWVAKDPNKWLYFHSINQLTLKGGGTINGMGWKWWAKSCKINKTNPCRSTPKAVTFHRTRNLKVKQLMFVDSPQMHIPLTDSYKVRVEKIYIQAPFWSPNTDGIHVSGSSKVLIDDVVVQTGDDCVSIVNQSCKVQIRNITCGPGHGISIGSLGKYKSWDGVKSVIVDGAFLSGTQNGLRIKTWQGGSGFAKEIVFRNILMENVSNPIIIDQYYCDQSKPCQNQTSNVKVDGVTYENIKGTSATTDAIKFACSDTCSCENIFLENIELSSASDEPVESYCWNAHGMSYGTAEPPACFRSCEICSS